MNKEELVGIIKQWVKTDNELRTLKMEVKRRTNQKKELNDRLMAIMRNNEIDCFNVKDGSINYSKKNMKKPMSIKFIHRILGEYYKNEEKANEVEEFILSNRDIVTQEKIVRKINKNVTGIDQCDIISDLSSIK